MSRRAAGEGSLYQDERGRWIGQASAGINPKTGKRRRVKVTGEPGESKTSVAKRLKQRIDTLTTPDAPKTVGELVEMWRKLSAPKKQSARTLAMTDSLIRSHIEPVLGRATVEGLTVDDVEAFLSARVDTLSKSTLKKLRSTLAQSYDFGIRRGYTQRNPARIAEMPAGAKVTREGRALTRDEVDLLLKVAEDHRLGAWVVVGVTLGLRPGEISGLTWDAIDFGRSTITVFQSLGLEDGPPTLKPTKTGNTRKLQLPRSASKALTAHRSRVREERRLAGDWPAEWEDLVFLSSYGNPLDRSSTRRMIQGMGKQAGIEGGLNPYDLRHTATTLMSDIMSAERLADLLGHKDTSMVHDHYLHPDTASITTAVEYWDR